MQIDIPIALKIDPPDWASSVAVKQIFQALDNNALFVGGCVRDTLCHLNNHDIDLATPLLPAEVLKRLERNNIKAIPTGVEHGTITAVINEQHYEITTLRRDVSTDGRRAVVEYTESWSEDAFRRDFTFNALLMDQHGSIYDPTNKGIKDLENGNVRFIGDARQRIREDYLRILRYFRFVARYAKNNNWDNVTLEVIKGEASGLKHISKERITEELVKILKAARPFFSLKKISDLNILDWLQLNDSLDEFCVRQEQFEEIDTLYRLAFIIDIEIANNQLILSKSQLSNISKFNALRTIYKQHDLNYLLYYFPHNIIIQCCLYLNAEYTALKEAIKSWANPKMPITGDDLKHAGAEQGPEMGLALKNCELWWVENNFEPNKKECLDKAISLLAASQDKTT